MKILTLSLASLSLLAGAVVVQDIPRAKPVEQHEWLQQLVGEWTVKTEMRTGPDAEPMVMESTESVRSIGGFWVLSEGKAEWMGQPFTSILTLGYDPDQKAFVGTWVDSMNARMWIYSGQLDEAKKVLTLDTQGPSFTDPTKTAKYRDVFEVVSRDRKVLTSSVQGEDGKWTQFVRAEFHRKP